MIFKSLEWTVLPRTFTFRLQIRDFNCLSCIQYDLKYYGVNNSISKAFCHSENSEYLNPKTAIRRGILSSNSTPSGLNCRS